MFSQNKSSIHSYFLFLSYVLIFEIFLTSTKRRFVNGLVSDQSNHWQKFKSIVLFAMNFVLFQFLFVFILPFQLVIIVFDKTKNKRKSLCIIHIYIFDNQKFCLLFKNFDLINYNPWWDSIPLIHIHITLNVALLNIIIKICYVHSFYLFSFISNEISFFLNP